jgi:division/cell wall cluster transcriptional repressor MraZ
MPKSGYSFNGEYFHQLDEKYRLKLPVKLLNTLLDHFGRECWMVRMPEKCIAIYPALVWDGERTAFLARLGPKVPGSTDARALTRIGGATSQEISVSPQGRVMLTEGFRRHIDVSEGDKVAVVGAEDRIEIWKGENWERYLEEQLAHYDEIVERTMGHINGKSSGEGKEK